jgi:hypothetical protein
MFPASKMMLSAKEKAGAPYREKLRTPARIFIARLTTSRRGWFETFQTVSLGSTLAICE